MSKGWLSIDIVIDAPAQVVWDAVTDWPAQSQWMMGTTVRNTKNDGSGVGGEFEAFTGIGRLGILDTMVITEWEPPRRVVVEHIGRLIRGPGIFEIFALPGDRCRFVWAEDLDLPLGLVGSLGWRLVKPVFGFGVKRSLEEFRRSVESGEPS